MESTREDVQVIDEEINPKQNIEETVKVEFDFGITAPVSLESSTKKRRGRKKKSDQVKTDETPKNSPQENESEITPRSGRKRKSINYFALANPDIILDVGNDDQGTAESMKLRDDGDSEDIVNTPKKAKLIGDNIKKENTFSESVIKCDEDSNAKVIYFKSELGEKSLNEGVTDTQILNSVGLKRGGASVEHTLENNPCVEEDENDTETEIHIRKEKSYRKTGHTTQMVNTLFSQIDFQKEVDGNNDPQEQKSSVKRARPSKGKRKAASKVKSEPDELELIPAEQKTVTCAVCKKEILRNDWPHHKQRYHNNLAWRVGQTPLDLTNMDLVKQILNGIYMAKKLFYCDQCDKSVKSVNGFLSHKSVCGKIIDDVKVSCEICQKKMMPVSLPSHMRHYHENKEIIEVVTAKKKGPESVTGKRVAAANAIKIIHQFNMESAAIHDSCKKYFDDLSFISSSVASTMLQKQLLGRKTVTCKYPNCDFACFSAHDLRQHLKFCMNKPNNGFVCKHCLFVELTVADMVKHIQMVHGVVIEEVKEWQPIPELRARGPEKSRKTIRQKQIIDGPKMPKKTPCFLPSQKKLDTIFEKSYEWTLDFCQKHYSTAIPEDHFPCLKKNWELTPVDMVKGYLPKMGYSCDVGFETVVDFQDVLHKDHTFRKFHLFESYLENNGNSTIFCGGPINAISWLPTPYTDKGNRQIVAVATRNHPDDKYTNDSNYNEKCIIQFWDVGPLQNLETSMNRPRLRFCLCFGHGPIWDMKWCPSNCFEKAEPFEDSKKLRKMGVLAVAGSDSDVYIYSVPFLKESSQFYNSRPVLLLQTSGKQELGTRKFYASRISWSKASGHKYLAVGYTNGMVALFDLWTDSKLLRRVDADNTILKPYKFFQAHYHHISAITLYHLNDGCRWLLTGSYDRAISLWDLNETSSPVQTVKRNIVNDAIWMTNWLCHVIAYDEASTVGQATSIVQQARDFLSDPLYLFHCSAAITCLTGSDWLNGIIQANSVGEIFATFPKQLMMNLSWKYMKNKKLLFGYTTLVEKDKTIEERLKENAEKEKALKNQLTVKTVIKSEDVPLNKEVTHLDYNPHYYEYEPLVYHEVDAKYGLLFCDHKMNSYSDFPPKLQEHMSFSSKMYASSKPNIYPLQAINKIEFNVNRQASTYYATGYQAGFVRLTCMRFLNKDPQLIADSLELNK